MTTSQSNPNPQDLAKQLAEARLGGHVLDLDLDLFIADLGAAQAIQKLAVAAYPSTRIGYKIGATSAEAQRLIGCDEPFYAPLFEHDFHEAGLHLPLKPGMLAIECEFAFRMGAETAKDPDAVNRETLLDAIETCHPALEIIGTRVRSEGLPGPKISIADFGLNAGFAPGEEIENWRDVDLAEAVVRGLVDGKQTNEGSGANVLGHPLKALEWLARALARDGSRLKTGDWVSTGTCLGVVPITQGATITGDFGAFGSVSLRFD